MTILEKAARAALEAMCEQDMNAYLDGDFRADEIARAVLMAIREPSRVDLTWAIDRDLSNCAPDVAESWRQEYERNWRAMIDHILKGE